MYTSQTASINGQFDFVLLLLFHGVSVDNTDNDGQTPLRAAVSNVQLEVLRDLLSNGGIVHIASKRHLTALLATADSDHWEVFCEFLKHRACVVTEINKMFRNFKRRS